MTATPGDANDADRGQRLDAALAEYLTALDAGNPISRAEWIAGHPDIADDLAACLDDYERINRLVEPCTADYPGETSLYESLPSLTGPSESSLADSEMTGATSYGTRVRYFGDFRLLGVIGRGGMGVVYLARQISLNRLVALKMIRAGRLADDDDRRRFNHEAEAVARLGHPNILTIFEVGDHDGRCYFSMPLVGGGSLARDLARYQGDLRLSARIGAEVADAVHHAHQRAILHRDLKPANILLDDDGRPLVADFGLSKRLDCDETSSGAFVGTPCYMAPEQTPGRYAAATTACDVYGIGAILYGMLTGRPPFRGDSTVEIFRRVAEERPERPSRLNPRVDRRLESICLKSLEKEPSLRYASAGAVAEDLRRWLRGEPVHARRAGIGTRLALWCRRRPALATTAALMLASAIAGTTGFIWQRHEVTRQRDVRLRVDRYFREAFLGYNDPLDFAYTRGAADLAALRAAVARIGDRFSDLPEAEAGIREAVGNTFRAMGRLDLAEPELRRSLGLRTAAPHPDPVDLAVARREYAALLVAVGRLADGGRLAGEAHAELCVRLGPKHRWALVARSTLAQWHLAAARPGESAKICREILDSNGHLEAPDVRLEIAVRVNLALALQANREPDAAEKQFESCLARVTTSGLPDGHPLVLNVINEYAKFLMTRSNFNAAESLLDQALAAIPTRADLLAPEAVLALERAGVLRYRLGQYVTAEAALKRAVEAGERLFPAAYPALLNDRHILADILMLREAWAAAESQYASIRQGRRSEAAQPAIAVAEACQHADALIELGRFAEAAERIEASLPALETRSKATGSAEDRKNLGRALTYHGAALIGQKKYAEAEKALRLAYEIRIAELRDGDRKTANTESLLGQALAAMGRDSEAEGYLRGGWKKLSNTPKQDRFGRAAKQRLDDFYGYRQQHAGRTRTESGQTPD